MKRYRSIKAMVIYFTEVQLGSFPRRVILSRRFCKTKESQNITVMVPLLIQQ